MDGPLSTYQHQDDMPTIPARSLAAGARRLGWARAFSLGISGAALIGILVSGGLLFDAWYARWAWERSDEHQQVQQQLAMGAPGLSEPTSQERSSRTDDDTEPASGSMMRADPTGRGGEQSGKPASQVLLPRDAPPVRAPAGPPSPAPSPDEAAAGPPSPGSGRVEVVGAELRFLDAPGEDAHATLTVTLANRTDAPTPPVTVSIPADWFDGYHIIGAIPSVLDDRTQDDGYRSFDFPGAAPGTDATLELHVTATNGDATAPTVRLALHDGEALGEVHPEIVVPRPPPGPVRALQVTRLGITTGVVDTSWEPPSFVAGQIRSTAALGKGNPVVVGHRRGLAGDVFARLVGVRLGDKVVAASREGEHRYVVSEIRTLSGNDITLMRPTETPRLTLMTCVGGWNLLTGDYSHRLWVIAEPPELARETLAATIARATQEAAASASPLDAAKARTDAMSARAALALMDAELRRRP